MNRKPEHKRWRLRCLLASEAQQASIGINLLVSTEASRLSRSPRVTIVDHRVLHNRPQVSLWRRETWRTPGGERHHAGSGETNDGDGDWRRRRRLRAPHAPWVCRVWDATARSRRHETGRDTRSWRR